VILIGLGPSSFDISRDIAGVAKEVHVATKPSPVLKGMKLENVRNICFHTLVCKITVIFIVCHNKMKMTFTWGHFFIQLCYYETEAI
jgi:hypothetical protein